MGFLRVAPGGRRSSRLYAWRTQRYPCRSEQEDRRLDLAAKTGGQRHYSSIIIAEIGGVRQYVQLTDKSLAGVAPKDGKLLWKAARKGGRLLSPPLSTLMATCMSLGYGIGCNLFKVAKGSDFTATQVYANKVMVNHHGGVVKLGEYLYGHSDSKGWTCQDFKSGEAMWQEKEKLGKARSFTRMGGSIVAKKGERGGCPCGSHRRRFLSKREGSLRLTGAGRRVGRIRSSRAASSTSATRTCCCVMT